jgi:hypothetical protein
MCRQEKSPAPRLPRSRWSDYRNQGERFGESIGHMAQVAISRYTTIHTDFWSAQGQRWFTSDRSDDNGIYQADSRR